MRIGKSLIWFSVAITLNLFLLSKMAQGAPLTLSWTYASQLVSLVGLTLLAVSFLLSGRFIFIEKIFGGLDKVYKYHHVTGGLAFVFILHHPLFLLVNALPNTSLAWRYIIFSNVPSFNFGVIGLYTMCLMLILTLLINLPYYLWKKTHELMGISLLFSSLHILTITSDVSRYFPLRLWVIVILVFSFWAVIYKKFLYQLVGPKFIYRVSSVQRFGDIVDIWLTPVSKAMKYKPGQFVFAEFSKFGKESHPYSIASARGDGSIRLAIKMLGDYTLRIREILEDDFVNLWGPYGYFFQTTFGNSDLVWVAGGIGVTPFLGLLDHEIELKTKRRVDFFYCFADEGDNVFAGEINKKIASDSNIKYWEYCSANQGRISAESILKNLGSFEGKKIMLCGPVPMMESLAEQFKKLGVKNKDIIFEDFNFK